MNMHKRMLAGLLACLLFAGTAAPVAAQDENEKTRKTEVIYAGMETDGQVREVLAVNGFEQKDGDTLVDYGPYEQIINLTNTDPIEMTGDRITIDTETFPFYYQGRMRDAQLPWTIDIRYALDETEAPAEELAGKDGAFSMRLSIAPNPRADQDFVESYLLQVMVNLPSDRFEGLSAEGATIASQGETSLITFTVMPGEEEEFLITADATDLEIGAMQIAGLPFSMDFDLPDLSDTTDDLVALQDAIQQLTAGVDDFTGGIGSIYNAAGELKSGAAGLSDGAYSLSDGLSQMTDGMHAYQAGLDRYVSELERGIGQFEMPSFDTGGLSALQSGSDQLYQGLLQLQEGMQHLAPDAAFGQGLDQVTDGAKELSAGMEQLMYGKDGQPGVIEGSEAIRDALRQVSDGLQSGLPELDEEGLEMVGRGLDDLIGGMQSFIEGLDSAVRNLDPEDLRVLISGLYGLKEDLQVSVYRLRNPEVDLSGVDSETNPQAAALYGVMLEESDRIEARLAAIDTAVAVIEDTSDLLDDIDTMRDATLRMIAGTRVVVDAIGETDLTAMLEDLPKLIEGMVLLSTQYDAFHEGLTTGLKAIHQGLDNPGGTPPGLVQGLEELTDGYARMTVPILDGMAALVPGAGQLAGGISQMVSILSSLADEFDISADLQQLISGSRQLAEGHRAMAAGASDLDSGLAAYATGIDAYAAGMVRFQEGMLALAGGGRTLSDGMHTLASETSGMDAQMKERMDEMMDEFLPEDAPKTSFVSKKNQGPVHVQFLYMSQPVYAPEEPEAPPAVQEERTIWERILDLFR